jgi:hypothetical protein
MENGLSLAAPSASAALTPRLRDRDFGDISPRAPRWWHDAPVLPDVSNGFRKIRKAARQSEFAKSVKR